MGHKSQEQLFEEVGGGKQESKWRVCVGEMKVMVELGHAHY